jgi:hypothetical protein
MALLPYITCNGLIPHPKSPTTCHTDDLGNFYNNNDQGRGIPAKLRKFSEKTGLLL